MGKAGASFKGAGGNVDEFISLISTATATTRQSADTVGTALKSISNRLLRMRSIDLAKSFGIDLVENGRFVGVYKAIQRIAEANKRFGQGNVEWANFLQDIAGLHQIGVFRSIVDNFDQAQDALRTSQQAGNKIADDSARAQDTLAVKITKTKEEVLKLTDALIADKGIRTATDGVLTLTKSLSSLLQQLLAVSPLLLALGSIKLARIALPSLPKGFGGTGGKAVYGPQNNPLILQQQQDAKMLARTNKIVADTTARFGATMGRAITPLATHFPNAVRRAQLTLSEFATSVKRNAANVTRGVLGVGTVALSMFGNQENEYIKATTNTMMTAMIASTMGLGKFTEGLATALVGLVAFGKASEEARDRRRRESVDKETEEYSTAQLRSGGVFDEDSRKATLRKMRDIQQLYVSAGIDDRSTLMQAISATGRQLTGEKFGVYGEARYQEDRDKVRQMITDMLPQLQKAQADIAERTSTPEQFTRDKLGREIYLLMKLFDRLSGTVGKFDRELAALYPKAAAANQPRQTAAADISGALSIRADQLRNMVGQNQYGFGGARFRETLTALPLADMERQQADAISRAFSVLPKILANTTWNSDEFEQQLAARLAEQGISSHIISSIDAAVSEMSFDDWQKSLENVGTASEKLLESYGNQRTALVDLIAATREASQELSSLLSAAFERQKDFTTERTKYLQQYDVLRTRMGGGPDSLLSDRTMQAEAFDLSGSVDVVALGNSLRAYQQQIDANTGDLMSIPRLQDGVERTRESLRKLADTSTRLASIQLRQSQLESTRDNKLSATEQLLLDPEGTATQMRSLESAWSQGITKLTPEQRKAAFDATRTFENIPLEKLGGLTGKQARERILSVEGEKLGLSIRPEEDELTRLRAEEVRIMADSLEAQRQLMMYAAQTAVNTEMLARNFGAAVAPMRPPEMAPPALAPQFNGVPQQMIAAPATQTSQRVVYQQQPTQAPQQMQLNAEGLIQSLGGFNAAAPQLSRSMDNFAEQMKLFPSSMTIAARHDVSVIINGAEVMNRLEPMVRDLVVATVVKKLNYFIRDQLPALRPID